MTELILHYFLISIFTYAISIYSSRIWDISCLLGRVNYPTSCLGTTSRKIVAPRNEKVGILYFMTTISQSLIKGLLNVRNSNIPGISWIRRVHISQVKVSQWRYSWKSLAVNTYNTKGMNEPAGIEYHGKTTANPASWNKHMMAVSWIYLRNIWIYLFTFNVMLYYII